MARALRVCTDCPDPAMPGATTCAAHHRTTTARGYGTGHQRGRASWLVIVTAGDATCWRCGRPIDPREPWDLGHDDDDRTVTRGPEHAAGCNRAAAGRRGSSMIH